MKKDKLTIKAKKEGYLARSAYKLLELQRKYYLIKKNSRVLDLGCWPGGWLQVILGITPFVVGVDIKKTEVEHIETHVMNILSDEIFSLGKFDVVLSDVAPHTTGDIKFDQYKSLELSTRSFQIAQKLLKKNGNFLVKIFQGPDSMKLLDKMKRRFRATRCIKPQASKQHSKEVYFLGLGFRD